MKLDLQSFEDFEKDANNCCCFHSIPLTQAVDMVTKMQDHMRVKYPQHEQHSYEYDIFIDKFLKRKEEETWSFKIDKWCKRQWDKFLFRTPKDVETPVQTFEDWKKEKENQYPAKHIMNSMGYPYFEYFYDIVENAKVFNTSEIKISDKLVEKLKYYKLI